MIEIRKICAVSLPILASKPAFFKLFQKMFSRNLKPLEDVTNCRNPFSPDFCPPDSIDGIHSFDRVLIPFSQQLRLVFGRHRFFSAPAMHSLRWITSDPSAGHLLSACAFLAAPCSFCQARKEKHIHSVAILAQAAFWRA